MWDGRGRVAIAGMSVSAISRQQSSPLGLLVAQACSMALDDAGLRPEEVDGIATYPFAGFRGTAEEGVHSVGVSYLLDHLQGLDNVRWFGECSAGLVVSAIIDAVSAIASGMCNVALVWRAMGMPSGRYHAAPSDEVSGEAQYFTPYHLFAPTQTHALAYQRYQKRYGARREHMATLAVNSRQNALLNEMAYFHDRPLTVEEYMSARMISSPLCLYDCDIPVFGAAAIVLCSSERARDCPNPPAYVLGFGQQTTRQRRLGGPIYTLADYMELGGRTARTVWETAGIGPKDVNVAQLYDGFSPSVWYWLEAAGFCSEGEAFQFIQDGAIALGGQLPVNTFGGSLSEGRMHGMGHVIEAVRQVTGRAEARQVLGAEVAAVFDGSPMLRGSGLAVSGRET